MQAQMYLMTLYTALIDWFGDAESCDTKFNSMGWYTAEGDTIELLVLLSLHSITLK